MEGYAPHSRSHFRAAPPPPSSAGAGAAIYKKSYTNGAAAGRNGFTAYDDVFGGPPKFGATPFAPRADDYSEIFGSFRSGRASSIPMLDLPPVDDSVAAFEALGCSGFEYSEIFGGFEFADFAVSYDELFRRSDVSEDSSDDAWTPVGTGSLSEESDPFAYSGRNQYFLNGEFHETNEDTMFNVSYNKVYQETREDSELFHEAQLSSVPGYTYVVEGSTTRKEDEERYSSGVADDIILCEDSSGNISVETPWKTSSNMSYGCVVEQSREFDKNAGGAHGFGLRPGFISVSDVSLRTDSSHLSPPSRPPPTTADREKDPASSTLDYEHGNSNTAETISEGGSVDLFDVELHAGSSSIASAAAMKEAVGRDKVKLDSAKELMKRKKGGAKDMPFMKNDLNREDNVRMVFDESISRDNELQSTLERESNGGEVYWEEMKGASEASQVLPDPMQPEDAVNGAAEPGQRKTAKNQNSYLDSGLAEGDGEWKVTTECYELVNNCNLKAERSLPDNIKIPVEEMNNFHFANVNGSTMSAKQLKQNMERIDASIRESEDSQSADETSELKDNRRRLRATKAASRNEFHEKMVKVAQDDHETVIRDHVETVKSENEGSEGDGAGWNPELWLVGEKNERRFDKAAQQVHYEKMRKEESYLVGGEVRSEDYLVLGDCDKKGKEDWWLKQNERKGTEVTAREETLQRVKKVAERDDNGRGLNDAHQTEEKKEACARKEAEAMKRTLSPRDENLIVLNEDLGQKEDGGNSRRHEKKHSDVMSKKIGGESRERENEIWDKEVQKADQCEKDVEEAFVPDYYGEKLNAENYKKHELATENISDERIIAARNHPTSERLEKSDSTYKNEDEVDVSEEEIEQPVEASELEKSPKMYDCSTMNEDQKMESKGDLRAEFKITEQNSDEELNLEIESEYFTYIGQYTLDERDYIVPEMAYECEELKSSNLPTSLDEEDIMPTAVACECEEKLENHAAQDLPMDEEKVEFGSRTLFGEMEPKTAAVADICMETKYLQKTAAGQYMMSEREGNVQKQSLSINTRQRVGNDVKAVEGDLDAEARENAAKLKREEEIERERLRELQLAKERENERELEREHLRKLEEERERERERELEKERLRKLEEERERELEKERLRKLEEEIKKEREKELEMLRLRRLEELRERERLKELEKDHLRKLEEENQREREKDLEMERLRKLEEEWEREREREKDRMGVESKLPAERGAVERATAEARQRAMADARERLEKACAEAREKSFGKVSKEAHLRTERAAVDRATAEARERAIEKAMAERATFETRERVERSASEKFSSYRNVELRHTSSASDLWNSDKSDGVESESAQRCKAKLERHRRTVERVSKALAEKNMRDIIAQREQAERNRLAETLDADIKRWSNGKEGNLRALLSTLQYILGPNSGWHPIPLTEVITSAAVKKAYRKATLCVHPDKLQQRGATIQQKYICEKVFDLLKDAWNRFNSEER